MSERASDIEATWASRLPELADDSRMMSANGSRNRVRGWLPTVSAPLPYGREPVRKR